MKGNKGIQRKVEQVELQPMTNCKSNDIVGTIHRLLFQVFPALLALLTESHTSYPLKHLGMIVGGECFLGGQGFYSQTENHPESES